MEHDDTILARARHIIGSTPMTGEFTANSLWGAELRRMLAAGEDLFVLDVRDRESYERGHIEGSVRIDFADWASEETLSILPAGRRIAVICETGDLASQVTAGLRMLGYDALAVKSGMPGWAREAGADELAEMIRSAGRTVERTPPERSWPEREDADRFLSPSGEELAAITRRWSENGWHASEGGPVPGVISPEELETALGDESARGDLFLLDLRREEDFEGVGHIPGAVQVDYEHALSDEALAMLPPDRTIVTICYTGNLAAQLTMMLRLLGRRSAVLANGMVCWSRTPTAHQFLKDIEGADGPLVSAG
ncbi:MAG: rhodanese-like domain-containing protein [Pseudomonadota bacterium]